jgi:hypothetical protein
MDDLRGIFILRRAKLRWNRQHRKREWNVIVCCMARQCPQEAKEFRAQMAK